MTFTDSDLLRLKEDGLIICFEGQKYFGTVEFNNEKLKALLARLGAAEGPFTSMHEAGSSEWWLDFVESKRAWRKVAGK